MFSGRLSLYDTVVPRGAAGVDRSTCIILHRNRWMRVLQSLAGDRKEIGNVCNLIYFLLTMFLPLCSKNIMMLFFAKRFVREDACKFAFIFYSKTYHNHHAAEQD